MQESLKSNINHSQQCHGFTLVELIITISILTIIGLFAFPAFVELITQERIKGDAYRIYSSMQHSQEMALHSGRPIAIIPIGDYEALNVTGHSNYSSQRWDDGSNLERQMISYWAGNEIVTGFIPEEIYFGNYNLNVRDSSFDQSVGKKYINDIQNAWKQDPSLIIKKENWITFANLDAINDKKNKGIRRVKITSTAQAEFTVINGKILLFDPSGYASSALSFAFSTEFDVFKPSKDAKIIASAGFCLPFIRIKEDASFLSLASRSRSNFMPYYGIHKNLPIDDQYFPFSTKYFGFCKEEY